MLLFFVSLFMYIFYVFQKFYVTEATGRASNFIPRFSFMLEWECPGMNIRLVRVKTATDFFSR